MFDPFVDDERRNRPARVRRLLERGPAEPQLRRRRQRPVIPLHSANKVYFPAAQLGWPGDTARAQFESHIQQARHCYLSAGEGKHCRGYLAEDQRHAPLYKCSR
jgi:hypothetical protein